MPDDSGYVEWWETVRGAVTVAAAMSALMAACVTLAITVGDGYHIAATIACAVAWILSLTMVRDAWRRRPRPTDRPGTVHL